MSNLILDDGFQGGSEFQYVPAGGAGTFVGMPTSPRVGRWAGWDDVAGGVASINQAGSGAYCGLIYPAQANNGFWKCPILRPETASDQLVIAYLDLFSDNSNQGTIPSLCLRYNPSTGQYYQLRMAVNPWVLQGYVVTLGTNARTAIGSPTSVSGSFSTSHYYALGGFAKGTSLALGLWDLGTTAPAQTGTPAYLGSPLAAWTATDSTLAGGGTTTLGLVSDCIYNMDYLPHRRVMAVVPTVAWGSPSCYSYTPSVVVGTAPTVTVCGIGTSWTSGTTWSATGATIATQSTNAASQAASITFSSIGSTGTITLSNGTDSGTATIAVANASPTIGALSVSANGPAGITVAWSAATGGASPYSYALYRMAAPLSQATPFLPPTYGTSVGTTSSPSLQDTAPGSTDVAYRVLVTDSNGMTAVSSQATFLRALQARQRGAAKVLGWFGDSITQGVGASDVGVTDFVSVANGLIATALPGFAVSSHNYGDPGTTASQSTAAPYPWGTYVPEAVTAGVTDAFILLGTNDSNAIHSVPASTMLAGLATGIAALKAAGIVRIYLSAPPMMDCPTSGGGFIDGVSPGLIYGYRDGLHTLADNSTAWVLDTAAPDAFQQNLSSYLNLSGGGDGLHPGDAGHAALANFMATGYLAILDAVPGAATPLPQLGSPFVRGN